MKRKKIEMVTMMRLKMGLVLLIYLGLILFLNEMVFGKMLTGFLGIYVLPSILWLLLIISIIFLFPKVCLNTKLRYRKLFYLAGLLSALFGVAALIVSGLLEGFGRSPYDHSFLGIIINIGYLGSMLIGMELARNWLINSLFVKNSDFGIGITALLFTLFTFSMNRLTSFENAVDGARFAGSTFLPALSENILTSYLAFLGGVIPAIIYRGILQGYQWFSPVLPNPSWIVEAIVGTFIPAFCLVLLYQLYTIEIKKEKKRDRENPVGWVIASVFSIIIIWFAVGVFNIFPNVIVSGSMHPYIEVGDIVIVRKIEPENIREGHIIQFSKDQVRVNHRVIDIKEDERGLPLFITKGDANESPDRDPVIAEQLRGKVVQVIPRVGWLTIWMRTPG